MAFKNSLALWKDDEKVAHRLAVIEAVLEQAVKDYPLEIRNR